MSSANPRQLLLVVEGTAALGHHWELLRTEYLDKIIRSFFDGESLNQKTTGPVAELALVVFHTHGPYSGWLLQQTGWTSSLDRFWEMLSCINFTGGGFGDAAIAEGLATALLMCCPTPLPNSISQVTERQKHCILVAASNPHRLPTPIPRPPVQCLLQPSSGSDPSAVEHWWLADADTVAKAFSQCSVSLSVVSPRQLPSLKTIYNVAKRSTRAADTPIEVSKFAHHMVLISENFLEARQALIHSPGVSTALMTPMVLPKVEASSSTSLSSAPQAAAATVRGAITGRPSTSNGIMHTTTSLKEVSSISGMAASGVTHAASSALLQNAVPVPLSMSHSASSQDSSVVADSSIVQEFKPIGNGAAPSLRSGPANAGGVSLLPPSSQVRPILGISVANSLGIPGNPVSAGAIQLPGLLSSSSGSSMISSSQALINGPQNGLNLSNTQMGMAMGHNVGQGVGIVGFNNGGNLGTNPSLGAVPSGGPGNNSVSNMQVVGMGQPITALGQGNLSAGGTQIGPSGLVMAGQNVLPALGSVGVNPSPPTMIPTPGIAQPVQGLQPMGVVNSSALQTMAAVGGNALQVPAPVATPPQQPTAASKYAKIWEGILTGQRKHKPVQICKLEAYRQASSPETLAADWPSQMQIIRLIPQEHMNTKNFQGKSEILYFRTIGQHGQQEFLVQLALKKLCAVIQLPSQTLLLASTDAQKQDRMLGMLFPGDMVVLKPQISSQQQQPALMAGSTTTQAFSSQGQLPNQVRPQLLQPGQLPGQGPATGFMQ